MSTLLVSKKLSIVGQSNEKTRHDDILGEPSKI